MSEEAKYQEAVQRSIELFGEALLHQDFFACVKQIGVLEYLQVPDIEAYSGLAYHMAGEYKKAVELFEKVDPKSPIYGQIIHSLAIDYMFLGDYLALDELLCKEEYKCSALEELDIRIKCLEHSSAEYIRDNLEKLKAITSREVPPSNYQDNDAEIFFGICRMMADALVITGECMNQCGNYQRRLGEPLEKFSENDDMTPFIIQYQKWCHILSYSKYLQKIKIAGDIESLATCALYDKSWGDKLKIFVGTNYVSQIMQIVFTLCRPELHPNVDAYRAIECVLEAYIHIQPQAIAQIIDHYFEIVAEAYKDNKSTAAQYIGYVYSEIIATEKDPFELRARIEAIRKADDKYDIDKVASEIKISRTLSRKGYDALINAEDAFSKSEGVTGAKDYSALSLQFYRILEIEYCEKLIIPLANDIDEAELGEAVKNCPDDDMRKKWQTDYNSLMKIKKQGQSSLEIGVVRTLLAHIVGWKSQNDDCAKILMNHIEKHLTSAGKTALMRKEMLDVIDKTSLEKYRVPGAHTGYLPFSVAKEARDYVKRNLELIETWFV